MIKTGNLAIIKKINRSLILETIRTEQPISRAEIAKKLQLSRSTVSIIVDELLVKKIVVELGYGDSTSVGGRRGMKIGFNPKSAYGVGVDIGGTKILIVITDLNGEVVFKQKVKSSKDINKIIQIIQAALDQSPVSLDQIIAMGIGIPAIINYKEGYVIDSPALQWSHLSIGQYFQDQFAFPVYFDNDVNCASFGERWLGSGQQADDMLFISIGTGVGTAIISKGELIHGHQFSAGEIGYFVSKADILEGKGNLPNDFGVFEKKTSGTALSSYGCSSIELFQRYEQKDQEAIVLIDDFILELSIGIANAVSLLNPEKVIIGGGVSKSLHLIIEKIRETVARLTPIKTSIELAHLGEEAGGIGAVALAFEQIQDNY